MANYRVAHGAISERIARGVPKPACDERMHVTMAGTIREPRKLRGADLNVDGRAQLGLWHGVSLGEPHIRGHLVEEQAATNSR